MYQFYYAKKGKRSDAVYKRSIKDVFEITAIKPTMWEEHCLECSAPVCFSSCPIYSARSDGRCKRFVNGISLSTNYIGCNNEAARIHFRKWANMMTIVYPGLLPIQTYHNMNKKNSYLGNFLKIIADSKFPTSFRWQSIRTLEFLRRKKLKALKNNYNEPDAFVFHGFSFYKQSFQLIIEFYDSHTSVFKSSVCILPGENLYVLDKAKFDTKCWTEGFLIKVYPENNIEADLEILWCDFVKGKYVYNEKPADKVKCLVWDLDNTIWDGILAETDNTDSLALRKDVLFTMEQLDQRGIIQSIASKNDFKNTWPVIEKLGISKYFLYPQIHWGAKSTSIESIAKSLNIGIDSIAFVDDSFFERNEVSSVWPQVRIYTEKDISKLLNYQAFDVMITEESKNRRLMYQAEAKRNQLIKIDKTSIVDFLKRCHLHITLFTQISPEEKLRCYELLVRTNQLNMSGVKYSSAEFELLFESNYNWAITCEDDFGSYGIVAFGQYLIENNVLIFKEFAMSCRVAGKYVESALFSYLLTKNNCAYGEFSVNKTKKNILLRNTLEEIGFSKMREGDKCIEYSFTSDLLNSGLVKVFER